MSQDKHVYSFNVDDELHDETEELLDTINSKILPLKINRSTLLYEALTHFLDNVDVDQYCRKLSKQSTTQGQLERRVRGISVNQIAEVLIPGNLYTTSDLVEILKMSKKSARQYLKNNRLFIPVEKGPYGTIIYKYINELTFDEKELDNIWKIQIQRTEDDEYEFNKYFYHLNGRAGQIEVALRFENNMDILYRALTSEIDPSKLKYFKDLSYFHLTHEKLSDIYYGDRRKKVISLIQAQEIMESLINLDMEESEPEKIGNINSRIHWNKDQAKSLLELEYLIYTLDDSTPNIDYVDKPKAPIKDQLEGFYDRHDLNGLPDDTVYAPSILEGLTSLRFGGIYEVRYKLKTMGRTFKKYGTLKLLSEQNFRLKSKLSKLTGAPITVKEVKIDKEYYQELMDYFYKSEKCIIPHERLGLKKIENIKTTKEIKKMWDGLINEGLHAALLNKKAFMEAIENLIIMNPAFDPFIESYIVDIDFGRLVPHAFGRHYLGEQFDQLCTMFSGFLNLPKALVPVWFESFKINILEELDFRSTYFK